jgi:hypothetical protein
MHLDLRSCDHEQCIEMFGQALERQQISLDGKPVKKAWIRSHICCQNLTNAKGGDPLYLNRDLGLPYEVSVAIVRLDNFYYGKNSKYFAIRGELKLLQYLDEESRNIFREFVQQDAARNV